MADHLILPKSFRYSVNYDATSVGETFEVTPVQGRPQDSYFAIINSGSGDIQVSIGSEDDPGDAFKIESGGSFEPLGGFFNRGPLVMSVTGTDTFTIIR